ncbi:hypothetical protein, partial [Neisseria sp. 23W00734]|uniref:hypothetical protein n=1 Tax=Neisseria sp. 23W00734 TaxID=3374307 RepID=UPI003756D15C
YVQSLTYNFWSASKKPTVNENIFCLFLSQCEARALTLIGNRFIKEQRRRSSEDVNYTGPGKLQSSRENRKNNAKSSYQ